jgi:FtsH-binding integral membrane protein
MVAEIRCRLCNSGTGFSLEIRQMKQKPSRRKQIMKKTLGTIVAAAAVVLLTATFGFAEYAAAGAANFPYFQLGCLIVGGLIMVSLKRKYDKMYTAEVVGAFALYTLLMALFTNPVIDAVKNIVT